MWRELAKVHHLHPPSDQSEVAMEAITVHLQPPITCRRPSIVTFRRPTIIRLMRNLPLQKLNIKQILLRNPSSPPNPTTATTTFFHNHQRLKILATMADNEPKQPSELIDLKKKEAEEKLPEPPEKPLPGDCCGNGCTPCVWDQYYEELEEYNKILLQHKNKNDSQSKS